MVELADVLEMISSLELIGLGNAPDLTTESKKVAYATAFLRAMSGVSPRDLQEATDAWIGASPFWPKPADIRKLCPSLNRKQVETQAAKESGIRWFSKVVARAGDFGPNAPGSMEFLKGSLATYVKSADPWGTGCANIAKVLAEGNPATHAALVAGIDAVGWREFHREGWKFRENRMREVFERAFAAAYEKYLLDNPKFNVIDFQEKKRIASQGAW